MASTFGILRRKSWFQLRGLRWASFGIGLLVPLFLWAGAAAAVRGWLPFPLSTYSVAVIFGEASPAVIGLLWAVFALIFTSQAFAGDRGDGTDRFLMERPISPRKIWLSRLTSATLSWLMVAIGQTLYLLALTLISSEGGWRDPAKGVFVIVAYAALLSVAALLAGAAAGEMMRSSMQSFALGVLIVSLPFLFVFFTVSAFPIAFLGDLHVGMLACLPLLLVLPIASWLAGCRGEPAGRGRLKRGALAIGVASILATTSFAVATPLALKYGHYGVRLTDADPTANRAFLLSRHQFTNGAWAIDFDRGERIRYFPPPVEETAWEPGGERFAVISASKSFGRIGKYRVETGTAKKVLSRIDLDAGFTSSFLSMEWFQGKLLIWEWRTLREGRIHYVDPSRGELLGTIDVAGPQQTMSLHFDEANGRVLLHRMIDEDARQYELRELDLAAMKISDELILEERDIPVSSVQALSPSGRYWFASVRDSSAKTRDIFVHDLHSGEIAGFPGGYSVTWLEGDRLIFLTREGEGGAETLQLWQPGEEPQPLRETDGRLLVVPSPDRKKFLLAEWMPEEPGASNALFRIRNSIFWDNDAETSAHLWEAGEWRDLTPLLRSLPTGSFFIGWSGPSMLWANDWGGELLIADPRADSNWAKR